MKLRKWSIPLVVLGLFILAIPLYLFNVNADTGPTYQIQILEISDSGTSALKDKLASQKNITIDTIRMKQYVAQRDDINGKYDAIYIGEGKYSTTSLSNITSGGKPVASAHNTTDIMNDITHLKAEEIINNYVNKGLPVIIHKDVLKQPANTNKPLKDQRILYSSFQKYSTPADQKSNVTFVNNASELVTLISQGGSNPSPLLTTMQQRPRISIDASSTLKDYSTDPSYSYTAGNKISFPFQIHHSPDLSNNRIRSNLYFSIDKVLQPTEYTLVATSNIKTAGLNQISYTLPKAYSGLLYWKLEVTDQITGLKDYTTGTIRFKDERTVVNVLQIMPTGGTNSNLATILNPKYTESDSFKLNIKAITFNDFNTSYAKNLNGNYDMLVFGFRDEYNKYGSISQESAKAVKQFIATGQSVMFTHDTIYTAPTEAGNTNWPIWVNNFQNDTGQIAPQTNLGLQNANPSTTVALVNNGLLTQYPFDLSKKPTSTDNILKVALTHNQYFTLNLEDPTVVPWYNIVGSNRDVNDSWNHYYTYSKGNVTYSGTGHTNASFPAWEQQLFVNTMHRAFIGANHAPKITVNAPTNNSVKPSYLKNLMLSYTVNDWDLKDRNLYTSVKYTSDGKELPMGYKDKLIRSGDTLSESFDNPLPDGGKLQIEITVRDAKGAQATEIINLTIEKASVNLETDRTLSSNVVDGKVLRGEDVIISYMIKPKNIPVSLDNVDDQVVDEFVISDLTYTEVFPANLEVSGADITTTGDPASGITVQKTFKDIIYQLSEVNGVKTYIPDTNQTLNFDIKVIPTVKGVYNLVNSSLEYRDIHSIPKELTLGVAKDYSIFMLGDINLDSNNGLTTEGGIASAGDIQSSKGFTIGEKLLVTRDAIIAGGSLRLNSANGGTIQGNAVYKDLYEKTDNVTITGMVQQGSPIDFTNTGEQLQYLSSALAKLGSNATATYDSNATQLKLSGTNQDFNIFNIEGSTFNAAKGLSITAPKESTVIINVNGTQLLVPIWGITLEGGISSDHILFNFHEVDKGTASTLNISAEMRGTVLAPWSDINLNANTYGSVIGSSLKNSSEGFHVYLDPFTGTFPSSTLTTTPTNGSNKPDELKKILFPDVGFEAIVKVISLTLENTTIRVGESLTLIPTINPEDANNQIIEWSSNRPDFVTVSNTGQITGLKPTNPDNPVEITIRSTDGSNKIATAKITVINPSLAITGDTEALVNDTKNILATYTTVRETVTNVDWKIKGEAEATYATIIPVANDMWNATFKATKTGIYTIVVTMKSDRHPQGIAAEHQITVGIEGISIIGDSSVNLGSVIKLDTVLVPTTAEKEDFTWSIDGDGSTYAEFIGTTTRNVIELKGKKATNKITIRVTAGGKSATHDVKITSTLDKLQFSNSEVTIPLGTSINLYPKLWPIPRSFPLDLIRDQLQWSFNSGSGSSSILSLDNNGNVTGLKKGYDYIKVTYANESSTPVTATIKVIVTSPTPGDDKY